ncbi:MAG: hypothetical protein EBU90_25015 [Proteobacteria bacterium]|nr:hypothetical protein [Pseudomonadota bacterium]
MDKARPTFEDEEPVNVFDYWEGANFKLRMKTVEGYPNYDQSTFAEPSAIADDDEEILAIAKQQHKLSEFLDAKNFKSYDELKKKLDMVLNGDFVGMTAEEIAEQEDRPVMEAPQPAAKPPVKVASKPAKEPSVTDDDDDVLSYFQSLTED